MSAANTYIDAATRSPMARRLRREIGLGDIVRLLTRLVAAALIIAGLGLWIAPSTANLPELFLMKLCASFFFSLVGLHLLFMAHKM